MPDVMLRHWTMEGAPALAAIMNNQDLQARLRDGIPFPYTKGDAEDFLRGALDAQGNSQYMFAIIYGDEVVGNVVVLGKDNVHSHTGEMGYCLAESHWGRGIMTEAVRQMCGYIFSQTDIIRIFAEPFASNGASCRILEKAGFQLEGTLRQNVLKDGKILDTKLYAILKAEGNRER